MGWIVRPYSLQLHHGACKESAETAPAGTRRNLPVTTMAACAAADAEWNAYADDGTIACAAVLRAADGDVVAARLDVVIRRCHV